MFPFLSRVFGTPHKRTRPASTRRKFQPALEALETREVPAVTLFRDINPGSNPSSPQDLLKVKVLNTVPRLFFTADDGVFGRELWISDGTPTGTRIVKDINSGSTGSDPQQLTAVNGILFFTADDGIHGREVWRSDGTFNGTVMIPEVYIGPNSSNPTELTNFNNRQLFFSATDGQLGQELWRYNTATGATIRVADIYVGAKDSSPTDLTFVVDAHGNKNLFFRADDGILGPELWRTRINPITHRIQTARLRDIYPGATGSNPFNITAVGHAVYFGADDGVHGAELWRSDGTVTGTYLVKDINPGGASSLVESATTLMAAVNVGTVIRPNRLIFAADNGFQGQELWISDGTMIGTKLIKDINPGSASSSPFMQQQHLPDRRFLIFRDSIPNVLFFGADDGVTGNELWRTNGQFGGTRLVRDINFGTADGLLNNQLIGITDKPHHKIYFAASNGANLFNNELWTSNDTVPGTKIVQDINPGSKPSDPNNFEIFGNALFFAADNGLQGRELWRLTPLT